MIIKKAEFTTSYGTEKQLPKLAQAEVVFSGRSNVGKSSLINKLCNRKSLARTSSQPGKTGTINFYSINEFFFVDLPGYGFAKVSDSERTRWGKLINGYFESNRNIKLVIQLLDCRHEPSNDDYDMLNYLTYHKIPFVIALTKGDKLNKTQTSQTDELFNSYCKDYSQEKIVFTSATKGTGMEELLNEIEKHITE